MELEGLKEAMLEELASRVARVLGPGDVVVLSGEVGAGKTTFVRAAAISLGVTERVTSPTYQLARGYEGLKDGRRVTVNHMDLYRLEGIEDRDALELDDYIEPDAVTFIEWADPALGAVENPSIVHIYHETPTTRRIRLDGPAAERLATC
ncbi:MAG: tRNA (adenosine(37)-N6)-threonylcarbamoyltransferase complex ATPase subunit type 1 TsaE [Actinomycetota bacterium]|nr:tRNA (adenosine(37)-N6)-threonylcarbamoyltransferase complex ATPase subunit type 1 TsaE [Rubrobacteraceae bacterium]MBA3635110.1 tRNA (adenosine(37)-N6)-threonylcarbamoyltransferase complex ATPase subunit type 1 TsaE [Rubrobacteraceae bacterium]MDQ3181987.1 tRNA (adenosine(37)-N6)-threonylcarbamoyltransferase complex ATPase subunit type 1 TsaE [Actinomycetota bacterium]